MKNGAHYNGHASASTARERSVLITGGSGFIGANVADRLLRDGERVLLYDNLSRAGVEQNYQWLRDMHGDQVRLQVSDTRDAQALEDAVNNASAVFHFAAQVAVTTSITSPREDFSVNALGTLNLLEALRRQANPPPVFFSSTNKVYGKLGTFRCEFSARATNLWTRRFENGESTNGRRWTSTVHTAARKDRRTPTCWIMRGLTDFARWSFG